MYSILVNIQMKKYRSNNAVKPVQKFQFFNQKRKSLKAYICSEKAILCKQRPLFFFSSCWVCLVVKKKVYRSGFALLYWRSCLTLFAFGLFWNWRHFDEGWIYTHVTLRMRQFTWSSSSLKVGRNMGWISNDQLVFTVDIILVFRETEIHSMKQNK